MKKILSLFLFLIFSGLNCGAELVVDDSIHSQIAQKYQLEKLPDLPSTIQDTDDIFTPNSFDLTPDSKYTPDQKSTAQQSAQNTPTTTTTQTSSPKKVQQTTQKTQTQPQQTKTFQTYGDEAIKIKKGTKFKVVNNYTLSDGLKKGTQISFVSTTPETNKYITIPKGTIFKGTVIDSHSPNLTGNGGLLVIKVNSFIYKGKTYPIEAKITIANQKHIFFNNIKGKRLYWKNAVKSTAKGKKFYNKMRAKTKKYFKPGIEIIISPIAFVTGTVVYGANIAVSPVLAIFSKGGKLTIPKNSNFEIKFLNDSFIY